MTDAKNTVGCSRNAHGTSFKYYINGITSYKKTSVFFTSFHFRTYVFLPNGGRGFWSFNRAHSFMMSLSKSKKGLQGTAMAIVVVVVTLFIGLFMIQKVADITAINNTSSMYSTFTSLVTNTSTIYSILVLVVIVAALSVAIYYLTRFGGGQGGAASGI